MAATQEILKQLQKAIQASQRAQSQLPVVVRGTQNVAGTGASGNQAVVSAGTGLSGVAATQTVVQVLSTARGSENTAVATTSQSGRPVYAYKVRIINPAKKSDVIVRQLNKFNSRFESVTALRIKLIEEFKEQVPNTVEFSVGYCEGSQQAKVWLVSSEDLHSMYLRYHKGGPITLWCDGKSRESSEEDQRGKRKRDSGVGAGRREEKEEEVESVYKELQGKHGKKYDTPRMRLWSRMICSGLHEDYDTPPDIPAFSGVTPKRPRKESLTDALTGAAVAFAQSFSESKSKGDSPKRLPIVDSLPVATGISPGKAVELRMKNLEQLRYLQQLFEDQILSEQEFSELKRGILSSLRKL